MDGPIQVYGENKAYLALCASQQTTPTSKHIHIIHCWVSEKIEDTEVRFTYIASADNVANLFTKAIFKPDFEALRDNLGLKDLELELEKKMKEGQES